MPTKHVTVLLGLTTVLLMIGAGGVFGAEAGARAAEIITKAADVRGLNPEQAAQRLPVQVEGVVTFTFNPRSCFVQDESAGIYVGNGVESPPLRVGDWVRVEGVTDPGDYTPIIVPSRFELLGRTNLPPARRVTYADLMTGREDSQWVEVVGLVRTADGRPEEPRAIEVDMGGGRITVFVPTVPGGDLTQLVDSTVRVRGVCGTWFNRLRQLFGIRLMVPRWEDITVEIPAPPDVLAQPSQPIGELLRFGPQGSYGHRVKVAGTVILQQPGRAFFLQDERHGLLVQSRQAGTLEPGDKVEVVGFPDTGEYTPMLRDAVWRKTASGAGPAPVLVRPDEALTGMHDSRLIAVEGRLLERSRNNLQTILLLEGEGRVFTALLESADPRAALAHLQNNSRLRVTGVCRIEVGEDWRAGPEWRAKAFHLLMRSPADVQLLALPPWWSLGRLLWVIGILTAIVLASLLWATVLRRKVRQQTRIIRQKLELEARLKERYRDLFESANDMVYTHDLSGRLTSINLAGEQLLGRSRAQMVNRCLADFIVEEQRPAARRWLQDVVEGKAPPTVDWDFLNARGERVRLETSPRLILHEGGEAEVEGIARDVTERRRLEREILEISTREQRRIGHDLHDGVCQQLAGIAVLADVLADKLEGDGRPEAADLRKLTDLVGQANQQTRGVARALFPVRLEENGLVSALQELAEGTAAFFNTPCHFHLDSAAQVPDATVALHLYYIAQEAILNAVKHGKARQIEIRLESNGGEGLALTVQNDGLPFQAQEGHARGMGIPIMNYRARMIGATISIQSPPGGGTRLVCQLLRREAAPLCGEGPRPPGPPQACVRATETINVKL
jgi:PAS domain S-box-containing protein